MIALSVSLNAQTIGGVWLASQSENCACRIFCRGIRPAPASAMSLRMFQQRAKICHSELVPFLAICVSFHSSFGLQLDNGTLSLKILLATLAGKSVPFVRDIAWAKRGDGAHVERQGCLRILRRDSGVFHSSTRQQPCKKKWKYCKILVNWWKLVIYIVVYLISLVAF